MNCQGAGQECIISYPRKKRETPQTRERRFSTLQQALGSLPRGDELPIDDQGAGSVDEFEVCVSVGSAGGSTEPEIKVWGIYTELVGH
jgi:hypothetical protein